ncbi:beta-ketoacyl synthase N-terminal-like domain-containing protein [Paenibacillus pini]|uniref:Amino acid adenylation domain n=1 Tax=Paenibacillus pini JCM 16418 TaxID=1236976 RepID=W7YNV5_9BACL|nr:beta-ketoacyl synthase N-terminal-like domain-containing protein [Paenibacillus pini]GAF06361.1 amino acid adenylation domain [Paenibacillus pini JCM 16418]
MKPMNIDVHQFKFNEQAPEISSEEGNEAGGQEVAIIGISVRLPGSDNWRQFWDHIEAGVDSTNSFPEQRRAFTDEFLQWTGKRAEDQSYMPGAYLEHIDQFDAKFFRMLPTEASLTSPDQRLLLESAWEALEDAGYGGTKLSGSTTGVYIGYVGDLGGYNYRQMIDEWVDPQHKPASIAAICLGLSQVGYPIFLI